ncbi:MAG: DNA repair protein RecN [Planctomycetes bacterium]|nr:DNA repair protein RecN [Planctomycetota bacterium]
MLSSLTISNFTVAKNLTIDFSAGFSAVTGETGAGKSITLDALNLCLGARADASMIRRGENQACISAIFDISNIAGAKEYLIEEGFGEDEECSIRRTINNNGRSKAFINGHPATVSQLSDLGEHLANICGQHAHYSLLKSANQREKLDMFGQHQPLLLSMEKAYATWRDTQKQLASLEAAQQQRHDRQQLLAYQVQELDEFSPMENEFSELEEEQQRLANANDLIESGHRNVSILCEGDDDNDVLSLLRRVTKSVEDMTSYDKRLTTVLNGCHAALSEAEEAANELRGYIDSIELDPQRLSEVESRFAKYIELARKHGVKPEELSEHHATLAEELAQIGKDEASLDSLRELVSSHEAEAASAAMVLHDSRIKVARSLSKSITDGMQELGMEGGSAQVEVSLLDEDEIGPHGMNAVNILIQTNPGESMGPLGKVASGGELSRISLIIHLALAEQYRVASLLFDEVDSGISGPTAAVVGSMLQKLGKHTQVISITHLPQVASYATEHYYVRKQQTENRTATEMLHLDYDGRVQEIARLLGGKVNSSKALENARELLADGAATL